MLIFFCRFQKVVRTPSERLIDIYFRGFEGCSNPTGTNEEEIRCKKKRITISLMLSKVHSLPEVEGVGEERVKDRYFFDDFRR